MQSSLSIMTNSLQTDALMTSMPTRTALLRYQTTESTWLGEGYKEFMREPWSPRHQCSESTEVDDGNSHRTAELNPVLVAGKADQSAN